MSIFFMALFSSCCDVFSVVITMKVATKGKKRMRTI